MNTPDYYRRKINTSSDYIDLVIRQFADPVQTLYDQYLKSEQEDREAMVLALIAKLILRR
jgi:hypothetical protein